MRRFAWSTRKRQGPAPDHTQDQPRHHRRGFPVYAPGCTVSEKLGKQPPQSFRHRLPSFIIGYSRKPPSRPPAGPAGRRSLKADRGPWTVERDRRRPRGATRALPRVTGPPCGPLDPPPPRKAAEPSKAVRDRLGPGMGVPPAWGSPENPPEGPKHSRATSVPALCHPKTLEFRHS